jgi:hypothetical protein
MKSCETEEWTLPSFRKPNLCTIDDLEKVVRKSTDLMAYIPDKCKIKRLPRSFLFTLIKEVAPHLYKDLKDKVDAREQAKDFKKLLTYNITLDQDIVNDIFSLPVRDVISLFNFSSSPPEPTDRHFSRQKRKEK